MTVEDQSGSYASATLKWLGLAEEVIQSFEAGLESFLEVLAGLETG